MSTKECGKKLLELGIFVYALLVLFMAILAIYIVCCNGDTKELVDLATVLGLMFVLADKLVFFWKELKKN